MLLSICKIALYLLTFWWLLSGPVRADNLATLPDVTCDGSVHALTTTAQRARWIQICASLFNHNSVRVGDEAVGPARGFKVTAGQTYRVPDAADYYTLSGVYYWCVAGDAFSVTYGY